MQPTAAHNEKMAKMTFAMVYRLYLTKLERKGRSKEELDQVIEWLTGYGVLEIERLLNEDVTFEVFFEQAKLNPNANLINGLICGYRIQKIENPLTRNVRYLDKLVDELAKGRKMEKILRS